MANKRPRLSVVENGTREDDEEDEATATTALELNALTVQDLPTEAIQVILSFVSNNTVNLLPLTLVCKCLLGGLDALCEKKLQQILQDHAVDPTFNRRIRNQDNIETNRTKPVENLPWRYLLCAALTTYLYKILDDNTNGDDEQEIPQKLVLSPSEDRIVMLRNSATVYSLSTKERLLVLDHEALVDVLWLDDRHVLSCSEENVRIWNETEPGEWSSRIVYGSGIINNGWVRNNYSVFFADIEYRPYGATLLCLKSLDYRSETVATNITINIREQDFENVYINQDELFVCGGKWLLIFAHMQSILGNWRAGIYLCNLETNTVVQSMERNIFEWNAIQCSDNSDFFYMIDSNRGLVTTWRLENSGHLFECSTFPVHGRYLKATTQSLVLVQNGQEVNAYDARTGDYLRCFRLAGYARATVSNKRNELLVADDGAASLRAFCLEEPRL